MYAAIVLSYCQFTDADVSVPEPEVNIEAEAPDLDIGGGIGGGFGLGGGIGGGLSADLSGDEIAAPEIKVKADAPEIDIGGGIGGGFGKSLKSAYYSGMSIKNISSKCKFYQYSIYHNTLKCKYCDVC